MPPDGCMDKDDEIRIYTTAIKKNVILSFVTKWMDLKDVMPSEVSQRKTNTVCYHLYVESIKQITQVYRYRTDW